MVVVVVVGVVKYTIGWYSCEQYLIWSVRSAQNQGHPQKKEEEEHEKSLDEFTNLSQSTDLLVIFFLNASYCSI